MSTKTTFKRVAAVAAAALTLGGLTAVSAHATYASDATPFIVAVADSGVTAAAVGTSVSAGGVAGVNNYVTLTGDAGISSALGTNTTLSVTVSGAGANILSASDGGGSWTLNNAAAAAGTLATAATSAANVSAAHLATASVKINTPSAGTITAVVAKNVLNTTAGTTTITTLQTFTITVAAASVVGTLSVGNSTSHITDSATVTGHSAASDFNADDANVTTDATVIAPKGSVGSSAIAAVVLVKLKDTQSPTPAIIGSKKLDATITGAGLIMGNDAAGHDLGTSVTKARVASFYTSTAGIGALGVYSDGTAGTGTITITYTDALNVTTTISTETITFFGGIAAITPTVVYGNVANLGTAWPSATPEVARAASTDMYNYAIKLKLTDSAGNLVKSNSAAITVKSSDTTKVSAGTCNYPATLNGYAYCSVTAVASAQGKATLTFSVGTAATFDLVTATADVTAVSKKASTFDITADATASSGQPITYTITAKDSAGNPVADGTLATDYLYAAGTTTAGGAMVDYSGNANAIGSLFSGVRFLGGVATDSVQAPFGSTSIVTTIYNAGAGVATTANALFASVALTNAVATLTTTVGGDSAVQAATDAAQEATDAANAAYDAANNAMDSADAATAAAQDAADNASAALAAVTSLSATVAKLVKSVAAIAAALAKVQKKIGA